MNFTRRSLFRGLAAALTARVLVDVAQIELPEFVREPVRVSALDLVNLNGLFKKAYPVPDINGDFYTIPFDQADWSGFAYAAPEKAET